jgi:hypothetical protein
VLFLPSAGEHRVVVRSTQPGLYVRALQGIPGLRPTDDATTEGPVAFTIVEGHVPDPLPSGGLLLVNPEGGLFGAGGELRDVRAQAVQPDHELLAGIDLQALMVYRARLIEPPPWLEVLVDSGHGPLLLAGEQAGRRVVVLAFDPQESNLPKLAAFPLLMANVADWLYPLAGVQWVRPGEAVRVAPGASVIGPDGQVSIAPDGMFEHTEQAGVYRVMTPGESLSFAVNMADPAESLAAPRPHPELERRAAPTGAGDEYAQSHPYSHSRPQPGQELWLPLAALALVLLSGEWLLYCWKRGQA